MARPQVIQVPSGTNLITKAKCLDCGVPVASRLRGDSHKPDCAWKARSVEYNIGLRARLDAAQTRVDAERSRRNERAATRKEGVAA